MQKISNSVAAEINEKVIKWNRHLYRHPEFSFQEEITSKLVMTRFVHLEIFI